MPTIKLTDQLGFGVEAEINPDSTIAKYIKSLTSLKFPQLDLDSLKNLTLDQAPLKNIQTGIEFEQPINIGVEDTELKIGAGVSGSFKLLSHSDEQLIDPEVFGDPIAIRPNQLYLGVGISASLLSDLTNKVGDLGFGFNAGSEIALTTYRLFEKSEPGPFPIFVEALKEAIAGFSIPGDLEDLTQMSIGSVVTVEGEGTIKFSGTVDVLSAVNPLASVNVPGLPEPFGELKVTSGGAIQVGAAFELTGAYQIRVQKTGDDKVRLGYYRKRGEEFSVKVLASSGVSVGVGKFDALEALLKAISSDPKADLEALKKGGLTDAQIEAIKKVVEAGISRKLEIALGFELSSKETVEAAFLFEFELDRLNETGRRVLHNALAGNLSGFAVKESELPPGVHLVRSVLTDIQTKKHSLKFNLLGIFNFISVSTLVLKGQVLFEPATGELIITDTATASRITASTLNFAADSEKLRKVLAESVLITVAYKCSKLVTHKPELKIAHSYFELHTKTDRTKIKNNLDVFEALGLIKESEGDELIGDSMQFGRTTLYAETAYDDALVNHLFLHNGAPRSQKEYDTAGRKAVALLVQQGEVDDFRHLPAVTDSLWEEMSRQGQANFGSIGALKNLSASSLGGIRSDYTVIKWWAESMKKMSETLADVRKFLDEHPAIDPEDKTFKSLRKKLASRLKDVASKTKRQFGDPWGLVAMDQAGGGRASAKALITGPSVSIFRERAT
jgi:hypothetical protein